MRDGVDFVVMRMSGLPRYAVKTCPIPFLNSMLRRSIFFLFLTTTGAFAQLDWGSAGVGGNGTWDTSTPNWFNGTSNVTWDGNAAIFGGTAGTVTISGSVLANQLTFNTPGYILTGGSVTGRTSGGLNIVTNADVTINSTLTTSTGTLVKAGTGSLILATPLSSSSTGKIQVNGGSLISTSSGTAPFGPNIQYVDLNNGELGVAPSGSGADVSQFVALPRFSYAGGSSVSIDRGSLSL